MRSKKMRFLSVLLCTTVIFSSLQYTKADETANTVFLNEIESNDTVTGNDWIEIYNAGTEDVDISGWYVVDDKGQERVDEAQEWPIGDGTVIKSGETLVVEHSDVLDNFSLGKNDTVTLCDSNGNVMDEYTYTGHAVGTYSRVPDGTGQFVDIAPTKGALNIVEEEEVIAQQLVINEVDSQKDDYIEVMNIGSDEMDISGYELRDSDDNHRWQFPADTKIEGKGILLVQNMVGLMYDELTESYVEGTLVDAYGIGSSDAIRLYDAEGTLIDTYSWSGHATYEDDPLVASYGRYPDGTGSFCLMKQTPGEANDWYAPQIVINEVEQDDGSNPDWVEIYNVGNIAVDISGWYMYDDDTVSHAGLITPIEEETILEPGKYYVFEEGKQFSFSLGKNDNVTIYNKDGVIIDEFYWTGHAEGVYARIPSGTGDFVDFSKGTKGKENVIVNDVVLNEVQSNGTTEKPAWIELANPTNADLNISGLVIKDDNDENAYTIPENTVIAPNGFMVLTEIDLGFELNDADTVRIFEDERVIGIVSWTENTNPTLGLYPDVYGLEYKTTREATPNLFNKFEGIPDMIDWPGANEVAIIDTEQMFLENASGLDFYNNQLYAVDNGSGVFWIFDVALDGTLSYTKGFESGKRVRYQKDAEDPTVAGPDIEGITVAEDGYIYFSSERDNNVKGVNWNTILQIDPNVEGTDLVAIKEWDITNSLPAVTSNLGIESIEWISSADVNGKIIDQNTNEAFDFANYPKAISGGVFFTGLEDNGHIYAYVLNEDGTSVQIADIDSKIGGIMALDYDTYEDVLWAVADNGYNNRAAKISFNGQVEPDVLHILPPTGVDVTLNNEGFAIASPEYTFNGQRPVYRLTDGLVTGSFTVGSIDCDYVADVPDEPTTKPSEPTTDAPTEKVTTAKTSSSRPARATIKSATKKKTAVKVKLSIKKVKGAKGYRVQISTNRKFKKKLVNKIVKKRNLTIISKNLKNKKKLYVRVKAYKLIGKKKVWAKKWSKVKQVKIKK